MSHLQIDKKNGIKFESFNEVKLWKREVFIRRNDYLRISMQIFVRIKKKRMKFWLIREFYDNTRSNNRSTVKAGFLHELKNKILELLIWYNIFSFSFSTKFNFDRFCYHHINNRLIHHSNNFEVLLHIHSLSSDLKLFQNTKTVCILLKTERTDSHVFVETVYNSSNKYFLLLIVFCCLWNSNFLLLIIVYRRIHHRTPHRRQQITFTKCSLFWNRLSQA